MINTDTGLTPEILKQMVWDKELAYLTNHRDLGNNSRENGAKRLRGKEEILAFIHKGILVQTRKIGEQVLG